MTFLTATQYSIAHMPSRYTIHQEAEYVLLVLGGDVRTADEVLAFVNSMLIDLKKRRCSKVLIDETALFVDVDQFETYSFAEKLATHLPAQGLRIATIYAPQNKEVYGWAETFLRNRSINYRTFPDKDSALKWLLK